MIQQLFNEILYISVYVSILITVVLLISLFLKNKFKPSAKYAAWLLIAVILFIPLSSYSVFIVKNDISTSNPIYDSQSGPVSNAVSPDGNEGQSNRTTPVNPASVIKSLKSVYRPISDATVKNTVEVPKFMLSLAVFWFVVSLCLMLLIIISELMLKFRIMNSSSPADPQLLQLVRSAGKKARVRRKLSVKIVPDFEAPSVFGIVRPMIIIPNENDFLNLPNEQIENILLHEMTHIKHMDNLIRLLFSLVRAVHWFNPAVWIMEAKLRNVQELNCDYRVLSNIPRDSYKTYADLLLNHYVLDNRSLRMRTPSLGSPKSTMRSRLHSILEFYKNGKTGSYIALFNILLVFLLSFFLFTPLVLGSYENTMTALENNRPDSPVTSLLDQTAGAEDDSVIEFITIDDTVLAFLLSDVFETTPDKISRQMLNSISKLEIWGDIIAVNKDLNDVVLYFSSDGCSVDFNEIPIYTRGKIKSLNDVLKMPNLEILSVNSQKITDIPDMSSLRKLKVIRLMSNEISDIALLSRLHGIIEVYLCNNSISDMTPLSAVETLQIIWLSNNEIRKIPDLSDMPVLMELQLSQNFIRDISGLEDIRNLRTLNIGDNSLISLDHLSRLDDINILNLCNNHIQDIEPLSGLITIKELNISYNYIKDISPLSKMKAMIFLNASANDIRDISPLLNLTILKELYIADNSHPFDDGVLGQMIWIRNIVTGQ